MVIVCESTLDQFRGPGRCEVCGKRCRIREAAHIFSRGSGQLDIPINLVSCGRTEAFECDCHLANHAKTNGQTVSRERLLRIAAVREATTPQAIADVVYWLRRLNKDASAAKIELALTDLDHEARTLARLTLQRAGKLELSF